MASWILKSFAGGGKTRFSSGTSVPRQWFRVAAFGRHDEEVANAPLFESSPDLVAQPEIHSFRRIAVASRHSCLEPVNSTLPIRIVARVDTPLFRLTE